MLREEKERKKKCCLWSSELTIFLHRGEQQGLILMYLFTTSTEESSQLGKGEEKSNSEYRHLSVPRVYSTWRTKALQ